VKMPNKAFITNEKTKTLKKRLTELIEHSEELKFLVGFFYFSGWSQIYNSLKDRDDLEIKVLVGLSVDKKLYSILEYAREGDNLTGEEKADDFFESLKIAINSEQLDNEEFYRQVDFFVKLIEEDKLRIKKTQEPNHAKLYIFKIKEHLKGIANCKFITGSSNLTKAGITEQNEFNVEIGDYGTEEAEKYFDELWDSAIDITEDVQRKRDLLDLIRNRSQAAIVTPFEAYVKVLKTYIDLQKQRQIKPHVSSLLEKKYKSYSFQRDAVNQALTIIDNYNGVIIADVVGLGKSVIASMIAKNIGKRGMIICPPGLIGDKSIPSGWNMYTQDFQLYEWEIYSSGDLEGAVRYLQQYGEDIELVIVDEAHRYRNQDTQSYEFLSSICRKRQVMLLTATPFNNSPADIFSLLKLFIVPGKSRITLDENLEARFSHYEKLFRRLSFITKNHNSRIDEKRTKAESYYKQLFDMLPVDISVVQAKSHQLASQIREVLEPIMIRRNRLDLKKDPVYSKEVTELSEVKNPEELFFELTKEQSEFYDEVIEDYFGEEGRFKGAIYQPFSYEQEIDEDKLDEEGNRLFQQQRNLFDFMRRLLVKRFESSFGSFSQSITNFIKVHDCVKEFIKKSKGKYVLERKIVEKAYENNPDELEEALLEYAQKLEEVTETKHNKVYELNEFHRKDRFYEDIDKDIELFKEIKAKIAKLKLVENDPKSERLIEVVRKIINAEPSNGEPVRKVIIFSEYTDTVKHLKPIMEEQFKDNVLTIAGNIGKKQNKTLLEDFDAGIEASHQNDNFSILLTSDKLSEGYNLNRAGAIINYDIPWNPTRVIQRVGRINRIGQKVFDNLYIHNFFPTEQGSDVVKSRQIASQKMFLIHNTLGEDCKIFAADETPAPSELYKRINTNPEEMEEENLLTKIRSEYNKIEKEHPEVINRVEHLPNRIKTAKGFDSYNLVVFRRKALGLFIQKSVIDKDENIKVEGLLIDDAIRHIRCSCDEKRLSLSRNFWQHYEKIKEHKDKFPVAKNEISLEVKAMNNLQSALKHYMSELEKYLPFIRDLIKDFRNYHTIPKYSVRRIANLKLDADRPKELKKFIKELELLISNLGTDYLEIVEKRVKDNRDEIIIAVENINK